MPRAKPEGGGWDDLHQRITFYCPRDLAQVIKAEMAATGRNKTHIIVDALRAHLLHNATDKATDETSG